MVLAVAFYEVVLAAHIASIVIALGVTFAYPVMYAVGLKREPRTMPGFHRIQDYVGKFVISPFLALALVCGIYLASKLEVWSAFYVQWGLAVIIVLGGLGGAFFSPRERKLAELAERDVSAAGTGEVAFSEEYLALRRQVATVGYIANILVLATIYFMTVKTS
ncbi:MAG TPA: hypothetical protein VNV44_06155 [Solirubrobacteraceae bacterium]|jgi:hypothetical protein|nr:hypothetical protein [Solirubrobacteraceae bacterium]